MLSNYIAIYVPGTTQETQAITEAQHQKTVEKVGAQLSAKFGGASAYDVRGFWMSDVHGLVIDRITVVKSFYNGDYTSAEVLEFARHIAQGLKDEFNQEAVTIETPEGIEFI